ncbi:MAG: glycosyltransferase, partial [Anaerolineales bacterium]
GGIPDLIEEGVDGLTFERRNAEDLAERMYRLWSDPGLRAKMGREGAAKIKERNDPARHYQELMKIYESV